MILILGIVDRVHIMVDINDDTKVVRRHAEVTGVVRRRRWSDEGYRRNRLTCGTRTERRSPCAACRSIGGDRENSERGDRQSLYASVIYLSLYGQSSPRPPKPIQARDHARPYQWRELGGLRGTSSFDRSQINLEQGLVLLALLLVLLSQADDLSNDLSIEAIALGFLKDFPLSFV